MAIGNPIFEAQLENLLGRIAKGARGCRLCGLCPAFHLDVTDYALNPTLTLRCHNSAHPACQFILEYAPSLADKASVVEKRGLALVDFWNDHHATPVPGKPGVDVL